MLQIGPSSDEKIDELRKEMQAAHQTMEKRLAELSARLEISDQLRNQQKYMTIVAFVFLLLVVLISK